MKNMNENTNVTTKNTSLTLITEQSFLDKRIRVFGTPEDPLFLARDVAEWIDYNVSSVNKMLANVDENEKPLGKLFRTVQIIKLKHGSLLRMACTKFSCSPGNRRLRSSRKKSRRS